ncbi:MAG: helix-hairpin-helix domain-containing protein [Oscillospiraceae bacterium]|nr:helix-hairpin-helix domain-containing protein [Oscillospiraceae bacterium]
MKKPGFGILAAVTFVFAAFVLGFFAGRNMNRTPVHIQTLPDATISAEETAAPTEAGLIDINTADVPLLQTLPGIGEVIAQRIIDYREANGPFQSIGELTKVEGIGEKKLEWIWDLVTTGG